MIVTNVSPGPPVAFLLSHLGGVVARGFAEALAPMGLEPRHFAVLGFVAAAEGQSQNALADGLAIPPSRMVAVIDELEERRLVQRRSHPTDRRARAVHVTPKGRKTMAAAAELAMAYEATVCSPLSVGERAALSDLLGRLAAAQGLDGVHHALRG